MSLTRKMFLGVIIMTTVGLVLSGIGYKNPVPSILPAGQFEEGLLLCNEHNKHTSVFYEYYAQYTDGNWYLKYTGEDTDAIIRNIHKKHTKDGTAAHSFFDGTETFDRIPVDVFENYVLASLDIHNNQETAQAFILNCVYEKTLEGYTKRSAPDLVTKEDLYDLKTFLDDIHFNYPGLGSVQKPQQKESTLRGVRFFFILLPLIMLCCGIIFVLQFKVTPEYHAIIVKESERLDSGGLKEDVDPETKYVCELLTGLKYENIRPEG